LSVMGRRFGCSCGFRMGAAPADAFLAADAGAFAALG
jgi:hypothetical protein